MGVVVVVVVVVVVRVVVVVVVEEDFQQHDVIWLLSYSVSPMLARVRWNKTADAQTTFTHMVLYVGLGGGAPHEFLVDVGFGGIGSLAPLRLGTEEPQARCILLCTRAVVRCVCGAGVCVHASNCVCVCVCVCVVVFVYVWCAIAWACACALGVGVF